jgi:hypothetical protein
MKVYYFSNTLSFFFFNSSGSKGKEEDVRSIRRWQKESKGKRRMREIYVAGKKKSACTQR